MTGADAIVVLGCRIHASGALSRAARGRVQAAARAFHENGAPWLLVSGGRRWGAHFEALAIANELVRHGVPRLAIALELCSFSTVENAIFSAAILKRAGALRAAIVTCSWHMARAIAAFRRAGIDALPAPSEQASRRGRFRSARERVSQMLDGVRMMRATPLVQSAVHFSVAPPAALFLSRGVGAGARECA